MTKEIPLRPAGIALVDDEDFERVAEHRWHRVVYTRSPKIPYAQTAFDHTTTTLHRFVMNAPQGTLVDHINGNSLDCRKSNLRFCDNAQNLRNSKAHSDSQSGFKGVSFWSGHWRAQIWHSGKKIHLGAATTPEEAARLYDTKALELFGEFARLNFEREQPADDKPKAKGK